MDENATPVFETADSSRAEAPPEPTPIRIAPVSRGERISSVDVIRGFSLLGILLMNIVSFGLPHWAYDDPSVAGGATGPNLATWAINYILFEGKMRATFSMLFGASVIILTSRWEQRGNASGIADIYFRRTLWLIAFGMVHAYFFWWGDILYFYGVSGLFLFVLRKLPVKPLILTGLILLALNVPGHIMEGRNIQSLRQKAAAADAAAKAGKKLTDEQVEDQKSWAEKLKELKPDAKEIKKEVDDFRGGYWKVFAARAKVVPMIESIFFYRGGFFDVAGMMLLGMGLFKLGFFSAALTYRKYLLFAAAGYAIGLPLNLWTVISDIRSKFDPAVMSFSSATYDLERLVVALAHAAVVMMLCKAGSMQWLISRLAAVGQMALSNYFTDTIVCTTLFNGYGFGMYGRLERYQLYIVVAGLWGFQLIVSKIWLRHFRFGPAEWAWRSLTYWKRQPMKMEEATLMQSATA